MNHFNIYCDESCHLENDGINVMVLGAVWCPKSKLREVNQRIKQIKTRNAIPSNTELKWTKVSPSKLQVYKDLIDYFFDDDDLHFRAVIVPDKTRLDHARFNQTHEDWYYKMYFDMLKIIFSPNDRYEIYIDIKDSHSHEKAQKLQEVCCNSMYDFSHRIISRLQPIRSEEVQVMQLVDLLIGALAYHNRVFSDSHKKSSAKLELIEQIQKRSGYSLKKNTLYREEKCNLLVWESR